MAQKLLGCAGRAGQARNPLPGAKGLRPDHQTGQWLIVQLCACRGLVRGYEAWQGARLIRLQPLSSFSKLCYCLLCQKIA